MLAISRYKNEKFSFTFEFNLRLRYAANGYHGIPGFPRKYGRSAVEFWHAAEERHELKANIASYLRVDGTRGYETPAIFLEETRTIN
jgi:hypothetical protein